MGGVLVSLSEVRKGVARPARPACALAGLSSLSSDPLSKVGDAPSPLKDMPLSVVVVLMEEPERLEVRSFPWLPGLPVLLVLECLHVLGGRMGALLGSKDV